MTYNVTVLGNPNITKVIEADLVEYGGTWIRFYTKDWALIALFPAILTIVEPQHNNNE